MRRPVGACEGRRWSTLRGDRGVSSIEKGDGGVSPRSRLEKRRNIDFFLNSCGDSVAMMLPRTPLCVMNTLVQQTSSC